MLSAKKLPWRPSDQTVSDPMSSYWSNFAKTSNPNAAGLPDWPPYADHSGAQVMHFRSDARATPDSLRDRYLFLDELASRKR